VLISVTTPVLHTVGPLYGPATDVKEKSRVPRLGTDAVMYPASESRFPGSCGPWCNLRFPSWSTSRPSQTWPTPESGEAGLTYPVITA